jgi:hypothetical protein
MNENEWRRMYEGNWDAVDNVPGEDASVLNLTAIQEMAAKARALPRVTLREIVITRLAKEPIKITLKEPREGVVEDAEYILIHPATWAAWRSEIEIIFAPTQYTIGALFGIPVIESEDRARDLLLKALEMYLPTPRPIYWSPGA